VPNQVSWKNLLEAPANPADILPNMDQQEFEEHRLCHDVVQQARSGRCQFAAVGQEITGSAVPACLREATGALLTRVLASTLRQLRTRPVELPRPKISGGVTLTPFMKCPLSMDVTLLLRRISNTAEPSNSKRTPLRCGCCQCCWHLLQQQSH